MSAFATYVGVCDRFSFFLMFRRVMKSNSSVTIVLHACSRRTDITFRFLEFLSFLDEDCLYAAVDFTTAEP